MKKESEKQVHPAKLKFDPELKTVLFVLRDNGGCGFYRCLQPAMEMRRQGLMNTITDTQTTTREHVLQADVVVIQSPGSPQLNEALNFAKYHKKPVIVEIDDFVHSVSPNNPGYVSWNPSTLYLSRFVNGFIKADACVVSTNQLAREYFPLNSNIYVMPNYLNKDRWTHNVTKQKDGLIRIGWAGGNAHIDDLKMISPVMQKIVREYKGKVRFETMGITKKEFKGTFPMAEFADICPKCDYQGEYLSHGGQPLDNYPMVLASFGWDIALAPVVNTAFNNAKSDLKLKEYSAMGYAPIASKVTPYEEAKEDGCQVLLAKSFEDWYNYIKDLIDDPDKRNKMARKNKDWVERYWAEENVNKYSELLHKVIEEFKLKPNN